LRVDRRRRAVYSEGLAPWRRPSSLLVRCQLGRHRGGGSPAARDFAGHGDTGLSAACQPAGITADVHPSQIWTRSDHGLLPLGSRIRSCSRSLCMSDGLTLAEQRA
jgi:hypothetical protein